MTFYDTLERVRHKIQNPNDFRVGVKSVSSVTAGIAPVEICQKLAFWECRFPVTLP